MKKICIFLLIISTFTLLTSACTRKAKTSMVQAKRRFAQYVEVPQKSNSASVIDLSEGPKLHYDANLGPKNLNFDFKVVDPY